MLGFRGRILVHIHNDIFANLDDRYLCRINESVDSIIACSNSVLRPLRDRHTDLFRKSSVIYNGVDGKIFKRSNRTDSDRLIILFVGRLEENKGALLMVKVYSQIIKSFANTELHIVGDGGRNPDHKYISTVTAAVEECRSRGGKVVCHGYVSHDSVLPSLYAMASIFCFCSIKSEAFPMVVVEAMISELCVVASSIGGVEEAVGNTGLLFASGDVQDFTRKLVMALDDPRLRLRMAKSARERAIQLFSWSTINEQFENALGHVD